MTPRRLWERMKARMEINRREDLRTAMVAWSVWKSAHGRKAHVEPEDFVVGPKVKRERTDEEQVEALEAFLAPFRGQEQEVEDDGEDSP